MEYGELNTINLIDQEGKLYFATTAETAPELIAAAAGVRFEKVLFKVYYTSDYPAELGGE